jgi:hypothetical protein
LVLQYKQGDGSWTSFLSDTKEVTTTGNNFSLTLYQGYVFRLLLRGGAKNGFVSNEQTVTLSTVDTYFSSLSLDESMFITGVMSPWVGRGLQGSSTVKKLSDGSVVTGGVACQWYRVHPYTFQMTPIAGADSLTYITTTADLGYKLLVKFIGNETTVGGFYCMMSGMPVVSPNKSFVTNPGLSGFTLNLYQDLPKLDTGDLILRDKDWVKVPIASVTRTAPGVFQVNATLSLDKSSYYLQNNSTCWRICTEMVFGPMHDLMEGVNIDLNANALDRTLADGLQILFDAGSRQIRFVAASTVEEVRLYNLAGKQLQRWNPTATEGNLPADNLTPGLYLLRFRSEGGIQSRKIQLTR